MSQSKKNRLTKEMLLEKYINKSINDEEMHLLNLYALDDDFLFEAMEGLSLSKEDNTLIISELNKKLNAPRKNKVKFLPWIGVAAGLAVIVFSTILISNKVSNTLEHTMVMDSAAKEDVEEVTIAKDGMDDIAQTADVEPADTESLPAGQEKKWTQQSPKAQPTVIVEDESDAINIASEGIAKSEKPSQILEENEATELALIEQPIVADAGVAYEVKEAAKIGSTESEVAFSTRSETQDEVVTTSYSPAPPPAIKAKKTRSKLSAGAEKRVINSAELLNINFQNDKGKSLEGGKILQDYLSKNISREGLQPLLEDFKPIEMNFNFDIKNNSIELLKPLKEGEIFQLEVFNLLKSFENWNSINGIQETNERIKLLIDLNR